MTDPAQPPAVPAAPADAAVVPVAEPVRKGSGLGIFALVLGLGAFLVDIILTVVAISQAFSAISNLDMSNFSSLALAIAGWAFIGVIVFFGGLLVALLAVILGFVAAAKGRGRVAGVFAIIFGGLVLLTRIIGFVTLAGSGDLLSRIFGAAG